MRRCGIVHVLLLVTGTAVVASAQAPPEQSIRRIPLGADSVDILIRRFGDSQQLYCNLHDDEDTSVEAAERLLRDQPGRLVEIRHTGARNLEFRLDGVTYRCDPNRIFTPAGVRATLEKLSQWDPAAQAVVERLGKSLLELYDIPEASVVVALHNNTDGRYAASSYLPGGDLEKEAEVVFLGEGSDPDDFFFVTDRGLFEALRDRGQNVVLQDNRAVTDDGSLSVYCGQQKIPYVNVEAQHGHLDQQLHMLRVLSEVLP